MPLNAINELLSEVVSLLGASDELVTLKYFLLKNLLTATWSCEPSMQLVDLDGVKNFYNVVKALARDAIGFVRNVLLHG